MFGIQALLSDLTRAAPPALRALAAPILDAAEDALQVLAVRLVAREDEEEPAAAITLASLPDAAASFELPLAPGVSVRVDIGAAGLLDLVIGLGASRWAEIPLGSATLVLESGLVRAFDPETEEPTDEPVEVGLGGIVLRIGAGGEISVRRGEGDQAEGVAFMIGSSGVIVEVEEFLPGDGDEPGLAIGSASLRLAHWVGLSGLRAIKLEGARFGPEGFTCTAEAELGAPDGETLSFGGLELHGATLGVRIEASRLVRAAIRGGVTAPGFLGGGLLDLEVAVDADGHWLAGLRFGEGDDAATTFGTPFGDLAVSMLQLEITDGDVVLELDGELRPDPDGELPLPPVAVEGLRLGPGAAVSLAGAWIRPAEPLRFELAGVLRGEIAAFGFGLSDGLYWLGMTAGLAFEVGVSVAARVDRFRLLQRRGGPPDVDLAGVAFDLDTGGSLSVRGTVGRVGGNGGAGEGPCSVGEGDGPALSGGFYGQVLVQVPPVGLAVTGAVFIGEAEGGLPVFFVRMAAVLPAGIPLFATGLGFFGFGGLFARNLAPTVADGDWMTWYHAGTRGAGVQKWCPEPGALALGVETVLGTLADGGRTFAGRFLLLLVFPGPTILLVGEADLVTSPEKLLDPEAAPPFSGLLVYDAALGQLQFGLTGNVAFPSGASTDVLRIGGTLEAFFDFRRPSRWYVNLGTEQRPFEGSILELLSGHAYLQLDSRRLKAGAGAGLEWAAPENPVFEAYVRAFIGGEITTVYHPFQFSGGLAAEGEVRLAVLGVGARLALAAELGAQAPSPFKVRGEFSATIDVGFWDETVSFSLGWSDPEAPPAPPSAWPVASMGAVHERTGESWQFRQHTPNADGPWEPGLVQPEGHPRHGPDHPILVPFDARPTIRFSVPIRRESAGPAPLLGLFAGFAPGFTDAPGAPSVKSVRLSPLPEEGAVLREQHRDDLWFRTGRRFDGPHFEWPTVEGPPLPCVWTLEGGSDADGEPMGGPTLRLLSGNPLPPGMTDGEAPLVRELLEAAPAFPALDPAPQDAGDARQRLAEEHPTRLQGTALAALGGRRQGEERIQPWEAGLTLAPHTLYELSVVVDVPRYGEVETSAWLYALPPLPLGRRPVPEGRDVPTTRDYPYGSRLIDFGLYVRSTFPEATTRPVCRRAPCHLRFDSPWDPEPVLSETRLELRVAPVRGPVGPGPASTSYPVEVRQEPTPDEGGEHPLPPEDALWAGLLARGEVAVLGERFVLDDARWSASLQTSLTWARRPKTHPPPYPAAQPCSAHLRGTTDINGKVWESWFEFSFETTAYENLRHQIAAFPGIVVPWEAPAEALASLRAEQPSWVEIAPALSLGREPPPEQLELVCLWSEQEGRPLEVLGYLLRSPEPFCWSSPGAPVPGVRLNAWSTPLGREPTAFAHRSVPPTPAAIWRWTPHAVTFGDVGPDVWYVDLRCSEPVDLSGWRLVGLRGEGRGPLTLLQFGEELAHPYLDEETPFQVEAGETLRLYYTSERFDGALLPDPRHANLDPDVPPDEDFLDDLYEGAWLPRRRVIALARPSEGQPWDPEEGLRLERPAAAGGFDLVSDASSGPAPGEHRFGNHEVIVSPSGREQLLLLRPGDDVGRERASTGLQSLRIDATVGDWPGHDGEEATMQFWLDHEFLRRGGSD